MIKYEYYPSAGKQLWCHAKYPYNTPWIEGLACSLENLKIQVNGLKTVHRERLSYSWINLS